MEHRVVQIGDASGHSDHRIGHSVDLQHPQMLRKPLGDPQHDQAVEFKTVVQQLLHHPGGDKLDPTGCRSNEVIRLAGLSDDGAFTNPTSFWNTCQQHLFARALAYLCFE
eukprot:GILI01035951.1.p3 GENE.GILI01035951.1~~GILI01035951.1.p3  ORF type:complete len:110 (+),score=18.75 GILI01035951.1:128-457(+)